MEEENAVYGKDQGNTAKKVYVLFWHEFEDRGIVGIYQDKTKALAKHAELFLLPERIPKDPNGLERWVPQDPDDAIEEIELD